MTTLGFRLAGWTNIAGVLLFSLAFTNESLSAQNPVVFSSFGLVCIMLWGAAYLSVATAHRAVPMLSATFALEKFVYVATWLSWISQHGAELPALFDQSLLTGLFYAVYGPLDLAFGVFFAWVAQRDYRLAKAGG